MAEQNYPIATHLVYRDFAGAGTERDLAVVVGNREGLAMFSFSTSLVTGRHRLVGRERGSCNFLAFDARRGR